MNVFHKFAIKSLKLNRTRTIVTIIGIILSTAMLTAVTTTVSSVQQFLLEVTEKQNGCWHGVVSNITMKQIEEISKKKEVEKQASIQNIGYAKLPHSKNETSPYLYIGGLNGDYETLLPFYMKEGRMPKNENEIMMLQYRIKRYQAMGNGAMCQTLNGKLQKLLSQQVAM